MTAITVLAVIAIAQVCFLALLLGFLVERRRHGRLELARLAASRAGLTGPLQAWLATDGNVEPVVAALRKVPRGSVVGFTALLLRGVVPVDRRDELAARLRGEAWAQRAMGWAGSRFWWRRIEAARAFSVVGVPGDRAVVARLRADRQAEVAIAAIACLPLVADAGIVDRELDLYATLTPMLRQYLLATLREMPDLVDPQLAARLRPDAEPVALAGRVRLAAALELPRAMRAAVSLASHENASVRAAVANALSHMPTATNLRSLSTLLRDPNAAVREEAAASLGALGSPLAVPALVAAMRDPVWQVRRRAGLAMAQLGEAGRAVVDGLRADPDAYVASMATLASGLSEGALLELTET